MISLKEYDIVRVAAVTPKLKLGNPNANIQHIIEAMDKLKVEGCSLACFPELSVTGYSIGDLLYQDQLLTDAERSLEKLREYTGREKSALIVGCPIRSKDRLYNTAVFIAGGEYIGIIPKTYLCNTREFYEERWFAAEEHRSSDSIIINGQSVPFGADMIFTWKEFPHLRLGMEICEDLWAVVPPTSGMAIAGANVLFNLSASNEDIGKFRYRNQLVTSQSAKCLSAYVYASAGPWESSTDLVFSGHSLVAFNGGLIGETPRFSYETEYVVADIDLASLKNERLYSNSFTKSPVMDYRDIPFSMEEYKVSRTLLQHDTMPLVPSEKFSREAVVEEIIKLQATGLRRRIEQLGDIKLVLGVSGGLDSTLALIVCVTALQELGRPMTDIIGVTMPGLGTSDRTKNNADKLMELFGTTQRTIDISASSRQHLKDIGHNAETQDITFENAQARERTQVLMDLANMENGIVVGTGDLSEIALGWSTYNGDHMSMYNVNAGVPKTLISHIISHYADLLDNKELASVLKDIVGTPISPELVSADMGNIQSTEDIIGPYILHDFFLFYMVRRSYPPKKIFLLANETFAEVYDNEEILKWMKVFYRRFFTSQYKRSAMPDGPKVGSLSLSPRGDWRMPSDTDLKYWMDVLEQIKI
jgi:NAD+ synthase (glutamine-hydrolysing)